MPATAESTPMLPGLSPICGRSIVARFDSPHMSSDGGLLALREVELRLGIAQRLASCIIDPRDPSRVAHGLDQIIRTRMLMIAAGYEDGNDADTLRTDPLFKLAMGRLPDDADLCSQPTISRFENLPDARALLAMGRAMIDQYCASFRRAPARIVLDIDDTFDAVHGGQQLRLFNAHYDEYGFQPIVVFDGEGRMIAAVLRPACRPSGRQIVKWLRRLLAGLRANWPRRHVRVHGGGSHPPDRGRGRRDHVSRFDCDEARTELHDVTGQADVQPRPATPPCLSAPSQLRPEIQAMPTSDQEHAGSRLEAGAVVYR